MESILVQSWIVEFERAAREKRADTLDKEKLDWQRRRERDHEVERRSDEKQRERDEWTAFEAALAPPGRIADFKVQLDTYDTCTVEALIDNREALDAVRHRIEHMLEEAYVLPDGRRVFRTEDGQRVFDEHGQRVSPEIIDPNQIDDRKPTYESYRAAQDERDRHVAEQQQLFDYQRKLDEARERLDRGEITNGELNRLQRDLAEQMPDAIRRKLDQKDGDPAHLHTADPTPGYRPEMGATVGNGQPTPTKPALSPEAEASSDAFLRQAGFNSGSTPRL